MTPQEFTHSQGDALRTVQEALTYEGYAPDTLLQIEVKNLVNLAKCFIELENTIKQVRETVKAR